MCLNWQFISLNALCNQKHLKFCLWKIQTSARSVRESSLSPDLAWVDAIFYLSQLKRWMQQIHLLLCLWWHLLVVVVVSVLHSADQYIYNWPSLIQHMQFFYATILIHSICTAPFTSTDQTHITPAIVYSSHHHEIHWYTLSKLTFDFFTGMLYRQKTCRTARTPQAGKFTFTFTVMNIKQCHKENNTPWWQM